MKMKTIRPPAVAGMFYPENPDTLKDMIEQDLAQANPASVTSVPKVLIVPHAGYIFGEPLKHSF
jgi:AmmeMemoRadiSam system protein B